MTRLPILIAAALIFASSAAAAPPPSGKPGGHAEHRAGADGRGRHPQQGGVECPPSLHCELAPAAYQQNDPNDPTNYGNYDLADRPADGLAIRFVVIHDTEFGYADTI